MALHSYDIIVIGGGGTGLMAAYAAASEGCSVLLLEKGAALGGTTAMSVGTVAASNTELQRQAGIVGDTPDAHFEDMGLFNQTLANRDNLALRRILVDHATETIEILTRLGVVFMGPLPEPPHRVPRLHAILPHSRGFIVHLSKACADLGVLMQTGATVTALTRTGERVTGVEIHDQDGHKRQVTARKGVIIASGDFSAAPLSYKQHHMSGPLLDIGGINPLSTGDGQAMAEAIGGKVINGDLAWGPEIRFLAPPKPSIISKLPTWPSLAKLMVWAMKVVPPVLMRPFLLGFVTTFLAPSHNLFHKGAILINQKGERFCDELDRPQDHIGRQSPASGWIVFGHEVARQFDQWPNFISTAPGVGYAYLPDYENSRRDVVKKADTLAELAQIIGVPLTSLEASLQSHHETLSRNPALSPIHQGPFYALGPAISWIVFSEGGLNIDTEFRVLDGQGQPIPGLFAAGSSGQGGIILNGHGHHLGWAFTSGRLAGQRAAQEAGAVA